MNIDYAEKFINTDRKHLNFSDDVRIIERNSLRIMNPQMLAAFIGYLKFQHRNLGRIYFRWEKKNHKNTIPSLYRGNHITDKTIKIRTSAYEDLVDSIPELYKAYRFKREDINPLLQHYGIKTNWIDLVDNLYIAIWFSLHNNLSNSGFIKIFCEKNENDSLFISDLRNNHSSLSLRPHCQHGISATKAIKDWNLENINFNNYLVATVELPNNTLFELKGEIFTEKYMFPLKKVDNTFKLLSQKKLTTRINEIYTKYNLTDDELGIIS